MEIRITHREDRPRAGYGVRVQYADRSVPPEHYASPTLEGLTLILEHIVAGRHPRTTHGRRDCPMCRKEHRA